MTTNKLAHDGEPVWTPGGTACGCAKCERVRADTNESAAPGARGEPMREVHAALHALIAKAWDRQDHPDEYDAVIAAVMAVELAAREDEAAALRAPAAPVGETATRAEIEALCNMALAAIGYAACMPQFVSRDAISPEKRALASEAMRKLEAQVRTPAPAAPTLLTGDDALAVVHEQAAPGADTPERRAMFARVDAMAAPCPCAPGESCRVCGVAALEGVLAGGAEGEDDADRIVQHFALMADFARDRNTLYLEPRDEEDYRDLAESSRALAARSREAGELREEVRKLEDAIDWLNLNCRIVYYPLDGACPVEHNMAAQKDSWFELMDYRARAEPGGGADA